MIFLKKEVLVIKEKDAKHRLGSAADNTVSKKLPTLVPFLIISVASTVAYYFLNVNTPPMCDDLNLNFVFQGWYVDTISSPRVTNLNQIFEGAVLYYRIFRGRAIAMFLNQVFVVIGKQYFNVVNSILFTGITFLVYLHGNYGKKANWRLFLIICAAFWFLIPDFMEIVLFMNSSFHESWVVFFILLFLLPYRALASRENHLKYPMVTMLFVIPIGFLAGAFNEQSFGLSIGFPLLVMLYVFIREKKLPLWSILGLFSTTVGTLFVLLAPSTRTGFGENPIIAYFRGFPGNPMNTINISIAVTGELMLLSAVCLFWIYENAQHTERKKTKEKRMLTDSALSTIPLCRNNGKTVSKTVSGLLVVILAGSFFNAIVLPFFEPDPFRRVVFRLIFTLTVSLFMGLLIYYACRGNRSELWRSVLQRMTNSALKSRIVLQSVLFILVVASFVIAVKMQYDGGNKFFIFLFVTLAVVCIRVFLYLRTLAKSCAEKGTSVPSQNMDLPHRRRFSDKISAFMAKKNEIYIPTMFFASMVASVIISTALPYHPLRLFFTIFVSSALVFSSVISEVVHRLDSCEFLSSRVSSVKIFRIVAPIVLCAILVFDYGKEYRIYSNHYEVYTNTVESIINEVADGKRDIVVNRSEDLVPHLLKGGRLTSPVFYHMSLTGLGDDKDDVINKWNAYYLGADSIIGVD